MWDLVVSALLLTIHYFLPGNLRERWTFSGSALLASRSQLYVLFTSQFLHDGFAHLSNNVFFLIPVITALESFSDGLILVLVLLTCGSVGLLTMWAMARRQHGEVGDFVPSVGISPSMYGLAAFLAIAEPDMIMPASLGLPALFWVIAFVVASSLSARPKDPLVWLLAALLSAGIFLYLPTPTTAWWLAIYLAKCLFWDVYWLLRTKDQSLADHASHFGGLLAGILLGLLFHPFLNFLTAFPLHLGFLVNLLRWRLRPSGV